MRKNLFSLQKCIPSKWFLLGVIIVFSCAALNGVCEPASDDSAKKEEEEVDPKDAVYKIDGIDSLDKFEGKIIRSIKIQIKDVFEEPVDYGIYKTANQLKINTNESVVRRELLFKEGDEFNAFRLKESERILRQLKYLRNPVITPKLDGEFIDIIVVTQDTWTLIPTVNYSAGDGSGSRSVGISESNILGMGKRVEALVAQEENRTSFEGVYDDWRVLNSNLRMVLADFYRADGNRFTGVLNKPFRSLLDRHAWSVDADVSDTVGKLWQNGNERFIYRQKTVDLGGKYSWSFGPRQEQRRFSLGLDYQDHVFALPTTEDFQDSNVDPKDINEDPSLLAANRRYVGPSFTFESLRPRFVHMKYIDRFDRPDDYDLGNNFTASGTTALKTLGSVRDTLLFNLNQTGGKQFDPSSFIRGEVGFTGRYNEDGFENNLLHAESKYFNVLGDLYAKDIFLGKHTLAFGYSMDYGYNLDKDREFLLGADEGLRGYDARTFTGDKRFIVNVEDRVHIAEDVFKLMSVGAATFIDVGGSTFQSASSLLDDGVYGDAGIGLRLAFPRSAGGRTLRIDFAVPFRDGPDGSNAFEFRVIFAGGQVLSARTRSELSGAEKANVEVGTDR